MPKRFEKERADLRKAELALEAAIDREFPIGTRVKCWTGRGWMVGQVAGSAHSSRLVIRSERTQRVLYKGCNDVEHFDDI